MTKKNIYAFSSTFFFQWLVVIVILFLSRIPYFFGPHFYFDGDEAIVGIMAEDLLAGKNVPFYFYGQQYGFSFFEVVGVALGILFWGHTIWALKFGALLVFSVGATFIFKLFIKKGFSFWYALMLISIFLLYPGWMIWSAKARGGYVTAFTISCILLYITQLKKTELKWVLLVAALLALLMCAQFFIGLGISFLIFYWGMKDGKIKFMIGFLLMLIGSYFLIKLPAYWNSNYWPIPVSTQFHGDSIIPMIRAFPKVWLGYFYYEITFQPTLASLVFGFGYGLMLFVLGLKNYSKAFKPIQWNLLLLGLGGLISFLVIFFMKIPTYRYLLGIETVFLWIMILLFLELTPRNFLNKGLLCLVLIFGLGYSVSSRNIPDSWMCPKKNDKEMYGQLLEELGKRRINHVFSTDPLLQWMLCYSGINARHTSHVERTNTYLNKVNQCYNDSDCKTAIVGYKGMCNHMDEIEGWNDVVVFVNERFFIFENPENKHLTKGGYLFEN